MTSIIDEKPKTRDEQRREADEKKYQEALKEQVAFDAKELLPYVVANSAAAGLDPEAVVERAFAISAVMQRRMLEAGIELKPKPLPIIGQGMQPMPPQMAKALGLVG